MKVYPIFLNNLAGRRCVVFGTGHEAERKIQGLLDCDAEVVVISPEVSDTIRAWVEADQVVWEARTYRSGDLKDAFLAIVVEINPPVTRPIWEEAQERKVLINAMDDVPHCTFVAGSVVQRGPLVISISSSGSAPTLSVRIRQKMEREFGPEYAVFLTIMQSLREPMKAHYPEFEERRRRWYTLVDSDVLELIKVGEMSRAYRRIEELVGFEWSETFHEDIRLEF
jgi:siroheme synthase-like protein